MTLLSVTEGIIISTCFGLLMLALVLSRTQVQHGAEGFLLANRAIPLGQAVFSIAVSWVWAPAIFVCSMQAYNYGLPGIFWFTVPNVVCFFVFAPMALRLRRLLPEGYKPSANHF